MRLRLLTLLMVCAVLFVLVQRVSLEPDATPAEDEEAVAEVVESEANEESEGQSMPAVTFSPAPEPAEMDSERDQEAEPEKAGDTEQPMENAAGSGAGPGMRVNTRYESGGPVLEALLQRGARILLADGDYRVVARVQEDRSLGQVQPDDLSGVPRQDTAEVARFLSRPLPRGAVHGLVVWPDELWARLTGGVPDGVQHVRVRLSADGTGMWARLQPMPANDHEMISVRL